MTSKWTHESLIRACNQVNGFLKTEKTDINQTTKDLLSSILIGETAPKKMLEDFAQELAFENQPRRNPTDTEEFEKVLGTGDVAHILNFINEATKVDAETEKTLYFKNEINEEEKNVQDFLKAVEFGFLDSAIEIISTQFRKIEQQKRRTIK